MEKEQKSNKKTLIIVTVLLGIVMLFCIGIFAIFMLLSQFDSTDSYKDTPLIYSFIALMVCIGYFLIKNLINIFKKPNINLNEANPLEKNLIHETTPQNFFGRKSIIFVAIVVTGFIGYIALGVFSGNSITDVLVHFVATIFGLVAYISMGFVWLVLFVVSLFRT